MTWANKLIFFLVCALIVFTALAYGTVHQPVIAFFYLIVALLPILWATDALLSGSVRFSASLLQLPLAALVIYAFIQVIPFGSATDSTGLANVPRTISADPFSTKVFALHVFALLIFFSAALIYTNTAKRLQKIVSVITIFGFIFAFFAILQSVLSPAKIYGIYETRGGTPFGSFVNRNNFAAFMELTLSLPLGLMFVGGVKKDKRLLYVTAIALMGIALILSGSRGGLIAFAAEVLFLVILTTKSRNVTQYALKIGLSLLLVAAVVGGSYFVGGESSLTRLAETGLGENTNVNRAHIWNAAVEIIKSNFPLGAGLGAFGVVYTGYDSFSGVERVEQAHNDFLQIAADAGVVGLIIAGFFIFQLFSSGVKNLKTENTVRRGIVAGALAGCFGILMHSLFDFVLHTTAVSVLFLAVVSLTVSTGNDYADDAPNDQPRKRRRKSSATVTPIDSARKHPPAADDK